MGDKIIEVIGPPGVGKSTIFQALCREWQPHFNWIYQDVLLSPEKPAVNQFGQWLKYHGYQLLGKKSAKSIPVEYGTRFADENKELAKFYWDYLSNSGLPHNGQAAHRFRSAYFLFSDFCRYQAIRETTCNKPCIIDEGFLQKSFLIHTDHHKMRQLIDHYLTLVPLPYALLYINTAQKNIISQRLRNRKKIHISHIGKDDAALMKETEKWQYLFNTILEKIETRNVLIYLIDGEQPVANNVALIKGFLAQIK